MHATVSEMLSSASFVTLPAVAVGNVVIRAKVKAPPRPTTPRGNYMGALSCKPPPRKPRPLAAVVRWDSDTSRGPTRRPTTPHPRNPPPKPRK